MGDTNPNIQRVSFEEIQEFKDLDLFNLTWEQTNGRQVLLDPRTDFGFTYAAPGATPKHFFVLWLLFNYS
jgi:hypothetical protein